MSVIMGKFAKERIREAMEIKAVELQLSKELGDGVKIRLEEKKDWHGNTMFTYYVNYPSKFLSMGRELMFYTIKIKEDKFEIHNRFTMGEPLVFDKLSHVLRVLGMLGRG